MPEFDPVSYIMGARAGSTMSSLTDVDITNPVDGQVIAYDGATGKWVNARSGMIDVEVAGSDPVITGVDNHRYVCGEAK